ncbi:hypothetical protein AN191_05365 [Loktanella sp. 5RATIMAR09]|uniref:hypothetical protein n=1 Tax=Loktanella sp. 5RATIMAR09 TaxID=1225655 RepID=UPI000707DD82|nr:hypothetical protein [Loktanella sp. 5RATIMAR09]KQI72462.1 hypothetical protein AN191_05365 [Loktanella sp. 5RATIMAR09]
MAETSFGTIEPSPDFHAQIAKAEAFLMGSVKEEQTLLGMQADPAAATRAAGFDIPGQFESEFNKMFAVTIAPDLALARASLEKGLLSWPSAKCSACSIVVWAVAGAIVVVGGVALASLTTSSGCVVALAQLVGCSAKVALLFIQGLGTYVAKGVTDVAHAICTWTGAC